MRSALVRLGFLGSVVLLSVGSFAACSAANGGGSDFDEAGGGSPGSGNGATTTTGSGDGLGGDLGLGGSGSVGSTGTGQSCVSGENEDQDKDGFSVAQGDCNDCDPNVNPGAIEVIASAADGDGGVPPAADEDCDGVVDNVPTPCDDNLALDDQDPKSGAKAIDLCRFPPAGNNSWGVLDAKYVRADGSPFPNPGLQVGIQTAYGPNVNTQGGKRLFAISSGNARVAGQPGNCNEQNGGFGGNSCMHNIGVPPPPGFPQDVGCGGSATINDDVGLEVKLRAPKNATGYSFDFFFYSFEYPEWVCTSFNDQYITLVSPAPPGAKNGNISFDSMKNPVSVNVAFFEVCDGCKLGKDQMAGTGFNEWNDAGGTGWLKTQAPITGGAEFTIRFTIWDTGDTAYDSTTLIDNFQWIANGGTVTIGTDPIATPK